MKGIKLSLEVIFVLATMFVCSTLTHGQQRTFVASTGNDANNCSRANPCRNFQRAHDVVAAGGEVIALDSAGFGTVNINKSVTISGEGVRAAISTVGGHWRKHHGRRRDCCYSRVNDLRYQQRER